MGPPSYMRSDNDRNVVMRRIAVITVLLQNHFALKQQLLAYPVFFPNSSLHSHQEQGPGKLQHVANNR